MEHARRRPRCRIEHDSPARGVFGRQAPDPGGGAKGARGGLRRTVGRLGADPPDEGAIAAARADARQALAELAVPAPNAGLAVGGSARAVAKMVGSTLGPDQLHEALRLLQERRTAKLAREFGIGRARARLVAGGAVIL